MRARGRGGAEGAQGWFGGTYRSLRGARGLQRRFPCTVRVERREPPDSETRGVHAGGRGWPCWGEEGRSQLGARGQSSPHSGPRVSCSSAETARKLPKTAKDKNAPPEYSITPLTPTPFPSLEPKLSRPRAQSASRLPPIDRPTQVVQDHIGEEICRLREGFHVHHVHCGVGGRRTHQCARRERTGRESRNAP